MKTNNNKKSSRNIFELLSMTGFHEIDSGVTTSSGERIRLFVLLCDSRFQNRVCRTLSVRQRKHSPEESIGCRHCTDRAERQSVEGGIIPVYLLTPITFSMLLVRIANRQTSPSWVSISSTSARRCMSAASGIRLSLFIRWWISHALIASKHAASVHHKI